MVYPSPRGSIGTFWTSQGCADSVIFVAVVAVCPSPTIHANECESYFTNWSSPCHARFIYCICLRALGTFLLLQANHHVSKNHYDNTYREREMWVHVVSLLCPVFDLVRNLSICLAPLVVLPFLLLPFLPVSLISVFDLLQRFTVEYWQTHFKLSLSQSLSLMNQSGYTENRSAPGFSTLPVLGTRCPS